MPNLWTTHLKSRYQRLAELAQTPIPSETTTNDFRGRTVSNPLIVAPLVVGRATTAPPLPMASAPVVVPAIDLDVLLGRRGDGSDFNAIQSATATRPISNSSISTMLDLSPPPLVIPEVPVAPAATATPSISFKGKEVFGLLLLVILAIFLMRR